MHYHTLKSDFAVHTRYGMWQKTRLKQTLKYVVYWRYLLVLFLTHELILPAAERLPPPPFSYQLRKVCDNLKYLCWHIELNLNKFFE
jgi:hypothetical protein